MKNIASRYNPDSEDRERERDHFIDPSYRDEKENLKEIIASLRENVPEDEDLASYYGFTSSSDLRTFVKNTLMTDENDAERAWDALSEPICPYCEQDSTPNDPALDVYSGEIRDEDLPHRPKVDQVNREVTILYCSTHEGAWLEFETKTGYEEK